MAAPKGNKFSKGRPAGAGNSVTQSIKQSYLDAYRLLQEDNETNIVAWARQNLSEFYKLTQKLVPTALEADVEHSGSIQHNHTVTVEDKEILNWFKGN